MQGVVNAYPTAAHRSGPSGDGSNAGPSVRTGLALLLAVLLSVVLTGCLTSGDPAPADADVDAPDRGG